MANAVGWGLPANPNDLTKEAIAVAVDRGWMLDRGDNVCLTDAGRELFRHGNRLAIATWAYGGQRKRAKHGTDT
jgi:hypothetical protein